MKSGSDKPMEATASRRESGRPWIYAGAFLGLMALGYFYPVAASQWRQIRFDLSRPSSSREDATPAEQAGQRLVETAIGHDQQPLHAAGFDYEEQQGEQIACRNCHGDSFQGRSEGTYQAPAIDWERLTVASQQQGVSVKFLLERAITRGLGLDGRKLAPIMPRFKLFDQDLENLMAWFRAKDHWREYGDQGTVIKIAVAQFQNALDDQLAEGLTRLFQDQVVHGRKLVFAAVDPHSPATSQHFFAGLGDGMLSLPDKNLGVMPRFIFEQKDMSASDGRQNIFYLLREPSSWLERTRANLNRDSTVAGTVRCQGQEIMPYLKEEILSRCTQSMASKGSILEVQNDSELVARWIERRPHEIGAPASPDGVDPEIWVQTVLLSRLLFQSIAAAPSPPRRTPAVDAIRSSVKFELSKNISSSFSRQSNIGLDGRFIMRWSASAQAYESNWYPF